MRVVEPCRPFGVANWNNSLSVASTKQPILPVNTKKQLNLQREQNFHFTGCGLETVLGYCARFSLIYCSSDFQGKYFRRILDRDWRLIVFASKSLFLAPSLSPFPRRHTRCRLHHVPELKTALGGTRNGVDLQTLLLLK